MKGKLIVVSGPSGAGKGTICSELLKKHPEIYLSVSCATRKPRPGEIDGVHYFFLTKDEFIRKLNEGGLLEHACINGGDYYGTPKDNVIQHLNDGKSVLLEIENNGAQQVIEKYPETVSVFILPPSKTELINRLVGRGTEDREKLLKRLRKVPSELEAASNYRFLIINDDVGNAVNRLEKLLYSQYNMVLGESELLHDLTESFKDEDDTLRILDNIYDKRNREVV